MNFSLPLLLLSRGAFSLSLRSPGGAASLRHLSVVLPSSASFGWRGGSPLKKTEMEGYFNEFPPPRMTVVRSSSAPPLPWVVVAPFPPPPPSVVVRLHPPTSMVVCPHSLGGGSNSTPSGRRWSPSSPLAGGVRQFLPSQSGVKPPPPLGGGSSPLPSGGRSALPLGGVGCWGVGCWVWFWVGRCVVGWFVSSVLRCCVVGCLVGCSVGCSVAKRLGVGWLGGWVEVLFFWR